MNDSYAATLHHSHSSNQKPYVVLDGLRGVASLIGDRPSDAVGRRMIPIIKERG